MIDERERFGRVMERFAPPDDAFERLVTRKGRKQRNQRVAAGAVGLLVALAAAIFLVRSLTSDGVPTTPPVEPTPAPTGIPGALTYAVDGSIYIANPDASNPVKIAARGVPADGCDGTVGYGAPTWSPDGTYLAFQRACYRPIRTGDVLSDQIVVIAYADGSPVAEIPASGFAWSPDSTRIAAWGDGQRTLDVYGVDGVRRASLPSPITGKPAENDPEWTPDGSALLVYSASPPGRMVVPLDGGRAQWFTGGEQIPSPDGTRVAVVEDDRLVITDADGAPISEVDEPLRGAAWSPDGDRLASVSAKGELVLVDAASGEVTVLPEAITASAEITSVNVVRGFSSDGDRILYAALVRDGGAVYNNLYSVGVDGSDPRLLAVGAMQGAWRPR